VVDLARFEFSDYYHSIILYSHHSLEEHRILTLLGQGLFHLELKRRLRELSLRETSPPFMHV
jgi:hypothetical protein